MFPQWEEGQADLLPETEADERTRSTTLGGREVRFFRVRPCREAMRVSACPIDELGVPAPDGRRQGGHLRHRRMFAWRTWEWLRMRVVGRRSKVAWGTTCRLTPRVTTDGKSKRSKDRGVQGQIHTPCRTGFVTKKAQPAPFVVPDSARLGRRIGWSRSKEGMQAAIPPELLRVSRVKLHGAASLTH